MIFSLWKVLLRTIWLSAVISFRIPIPLRVSPKQRRLYYLFKSWVLSQPQLLPFMDTCFLSGVKKLFDVQKSLMLEFLVLLIVHNSYTNIVSHWSIDQVIRNAWLLSQRVNFQKALSPAPRTANSQLKQALRLSSDVWSCLEGCLDVCLTKHSKQSYYTCPCTIMAMESLICAHISKQ